MNRIGDYALIGDCHTAALIGRDGSIDWACFPRFDSPSVFARALDAGRGGALQVAPQQVESVSRRYIERTNVLVTTFRSATGTLEVTDCMPIGRLDPEDATRVSSRETILRRLRCTQGSVRVQVTVAPRFEYASLVPLFRRLTTTTGMALGGAHALWVSATAPLIGQEDAFLGDWQMEVGQTEWLEAVWTPSNVERFLGRAPSADTLQTRLDDTIAFWQSWMSRCWYHGDHAALVERSALVLKALTFAPTGAVIAAPTTSLPEEIGGERNWDYRYTWIRDATLTLTSLLVLGFTDEAEAFKLWLERTSAGRPRDLQIMYGIRGDRLLPEFVLDHLDGHRGSRPVRVGNGAARQTQLDMYGQIMQAAWLYVNVDGRLTDADWWFLSHLAEITIERWRGPDQGIWEVRGPPRHFTHSKLNCWMALDRAIRIADRLNLPAPRARWVSQRRQIRSFILSQAAPDGWLRQAADSATPDAATLMAPAFGFLPTDHPVVQKTIAVVRRELEHDGLVDRYRVEQTDDGLTGGEGAFLLCSFWLVDCLTHAGQLDEAEELLHRLLGLGNDVGLFSEEIDPRTGDHLGNTPQAFTHMALVTSCAYLTAAKAGDIPRDGAIDYAALAVGRLRHQRAVAGAPGGRVAR